MANQQVDKLIAELSSILEQNRQKRNAMDAMLTGMQQGYTQAQQRAASGAAAAGTAAGRGASEAAKTAGAPSGAESSYGGDGKVSPYSRTGGMPRVSSSALSPSTTREGRLKLGGDYARTQQLLSENPYRMEENASYTPNTDPALEEQKRRFTQNLMLSRGESGGPLGGAGQPPPQGDGLDPNVVNAVSRSGGPVAPMMNLGGAQGPGQAQPMPAQGGPPAGWSPDDYALLESLSQRYPGG